MARIPDEQIERIKREVSIRRVVEASGVELRRHGTGDLVGRCPLHEDEEPSLVVTEAKGLWHCFGCGKAGNVLQWVMETRGVGFREAAAELLAGLGPMSSSPPPASLSPSSSSCPLDVGMTDAEMMKLSSATTTTP